MSICSLSHIGGMASCNPTSNKLSVKLLHLQRDYNISVFSEKKKVLIIPTYLTNDFSFW